MKINFKIFQCFIWSIMFAAGFSGCRRSDINSAGKFSESENQTASSGVAFKGKSITSFTLTKHGKFVWRNSDKVLLNRLNKELLNPTMPALENNIQGKRDYMECKFDFSDGGFFNTEGDLNIFSDRIYLSVYFADTGFMDQIISVRFDDIFNISSKEHSKIIQSLNIQSAEILNYPKSP